MSLIYSYLYRATLPGFAQQNSEMLPHLDLLFLHFVSFGELPILLSEVEKGKNGKDRRGVRRGGRNQYKKEDVQKADEQKRMRKGSSKMRQIDYVKPPFFLLSAFTPLRFEIRNN